MKEVTYEDWQKNSTPRMMWVWDNNPDNAIKRKVIYFSGKFVLHPVISLTEDETVGARFKHCAEIEIEIEKQRRMTNKELSRWLREKPTRECIWTFDGCICSVHTYNEKAANEEVHKDIRIRENDSDWREPLVEE